MSPRLEIHEPEQLRLSAPVPLTIHPAAVYLRALAPGSRRTMRQSLDAIAHLLTAGECDALTLDWASLRYHHTAAVQAALLESRDPVTVKKMISALRRVLKEARHLKQMDASDYEEAIDLPKIREAQKKLRGRALDGEEITALMRSCFDDPTPRGLRDTALLAILRGAGLRRSEVVKLEVRDFEADRRALEVRGGKGGKDRTVYLPRKATSMVEDWLAVRGRLPGALLCPILKSGEIQLRSLSAQAVLLIVQKRARWAGVESFSPHDFRRTFCSDLLDAGIDIATVQKLAGHASPVTTAKYDRRGEEVKRKAVQKLEF